MNVNQFNLLAEKLIKSDSQIKAVKISIFDNRTAAEAERMIHGKITATVARDVKRVKELFDFCLEVAK